jgi:hypothetical protein
MSSSVMGAFGSRLGLRRLASVPTPSVGRGRGGGGGIRPAKPPPAVRAEAGRAAPGAAAWGDGCLVSRGDWRSVDARRE